MLNHLLLLVVFQATREDTMAPTRKSRSVNKRFSYLNEVSPDKDGDNANKSRQRVSSGSMYTIVVNETTINLINVVVCT